MISSDAIVSLPVLDFAVVKDDGVATLVELGTRGGRFCDSTSCPINAYCSSACTMFATVAWLNVSCSIKAPVCFKAL